MLDVDEGEAEYILFIIHNNIRIEYYSLLIF
jgi:hypothetical protein